MRFLSAGAVQYGGHVSKTDSKQAFLHCDVDNDVAGSQYVGPPDWYCRTRRKEKGFQFVV